IPTIASPISTTRLPTGSRSARARTAASRSPTRGRARRSRTGDARTAGRRAAICLRVVFWGRTYQASPTAPLCSVIRRAFWFSVSKVDGTASPLPVPKVLRKLGSTTIGVARGSAGDGPDGVVGTVGELPHENDASADTRNAAVSAYFRRDI